jgi:deoxycytidylate deaminase
MKEIRFLNIARKLSRRSNHKNYQIGCVIARGGQLLGYGWNINQTHTHSPSRHKTIHAEFMATINLSSPCNGGSAYIFRKAKNGEWAMAKPCHECYAMLKRHGIREIVYSIASSFNKEKL